ncbi:MAG: DUF6456 domain-containing protein [Hyphomicrobiales bacterium]
MTKPATKQQPPRADLGTKERRRRGDIRITGEAKSDKRAKAETPVERLASQKDRNGNPKLNAAHVQAARRFYELAVISGDVSRTKTVNLAQEICGGAMSDDHAVKVADLKKEYQQAKRRVSGLWRQPMMAILIEEREVSLAGKMMGGSGNSAAAVAYPVLKDTLHRLAHFFGYIGDST